MVDCLVDTNIIVDLLRGYQPALTWIATQTVPGICRMVYMEVIQGATDRRNQRDVLKLMKRFVMVEHTQADFIWSTRQLIRHNLTDNIDLTDCLIAAPSHRLNLLLYTRNMKHFTPMIPNLVNQPY